MTSNYKDSFIFYRSFFEAIKDVNDEQKLNLFNAICNLALDDLETELSGISKTLFTLIKPQITANNRRFIDGKKGGRPTKITTGLQNEITTGLQNEITTGLQNEITTGLQNEITTGLQNEITTGLQNEITTGLQNEITTGLQNEITTGLQNEITTGFEKNKPNKNVNVNVNVNNNNNVNKNEKDLSQWLPIAERLANIISANKNIKIDGRKLSSWANDIRLLEKDGVSLDRQEKALTWYQQHIGEQYTPVIESGKSFREKIIKIESAMERENNKNNNTRSEREYPL